MRSLPLLPAGFLVSVVAAAGIAACGGASAPAQAPAPAPTAPPVASTPAPAVSASAPPSSDPTVLTPEQQARDAALAPQVEAILDAFGNMDASLSNDGKKVLFRSNRGGVPELYVADVDQPSAPSTKLVAGPERVVQPIYSADGKYVLFRRDHGADENFHVYRMPVAGGDPVDLTPDTGVERRDVLLARDKPGSIYYVSATHASPQSTFCEQPIAGGAPRTVYVDPAPAFTVDVNPRGTHALLARVLSPSNVQLLDVDIAKGQARVVSPTDGRSARVSAGAFSADGSRILYATDDGGETATLYAVDAATLAPKAKYVVANPATASIAGLQVSPRGDRIAVAVDAGDHSDLRVLDARKLTVERTIDAPLGSVELGLFSHDGGRFTFLESTPDKPTDVYVADAKTGAAKALRDDPRKGLGDLPALATTIESTKALDGLSIPLIVSLPKNATPGAKLPVIVEFHGGPADSSSVAWNFFARFYTSQGYAYVEPNIRGSTGFGRAYEMADNREKRGDAMKDVASVNAWVKAQPWADASKVVIFGGSYGGYLVLMGLTRQPDLWRAGVDLCGVANLFTMLASTDQSIRSAFVDEFGDLEKDKALLEEFSPFAQIDAVRAPLFVYQGQNDPRVPREESDQIVRSLRSHDVPVEYLVMPDEGHSIDRKESRIAFLTRTARFLADTMK